MQLKPTSCSPLAISSGVTVAVHCACCACCCRTAFSDVMYNPRYLFLSSPWDRGLRKPGALLQAYLPPKGWKLFKVQRHLKNSWYTPGHSGWSVFLFLEDQSIYWANLTFNDHQSDECSPKGELGGFTSIVFAATSGQVCVHMQSAVKGASIGPRRTTIFR